MVSEAEQEGPSENDCGLIVIVGPCIILKVALE